MRKNLTSKAILIVAILLVFVFGIFGIPNGISGQAWRDALSKRISLGLDLKGGTHLVLQVMVEEAVSAETDNAAGPSAERSSDRRRLRGLDGEAESVGPDDHPDLRRAGGQVERCAQHAGYQVWPAVQHQLDRRTATPSP